MTLRQGSGLAWQQDVLGVWFGLAKEQWFKPSAELDADIAERFRDLWKEQRGREAGAFLGSAEEALAAILLFDQFPRNMFRDDAQSFATDHLALAVAQAAIERGFDQQVDAKRRAFFYLPFEHSERLEDQRRAVSLFTALGDAESLDYAQKHLVIIERFGRFPHRNAMLGRKPRPDEIAAGDVKPF